MSDEKRLHRALEPGLSRKMNRPTVDVIIPTLNNPMYLDPCIRSIIATRRVWPVRTIIVNNGLSGSIQPLVEAEVEVIDTGGVNLGWEGGLNAGLEVSDAEYVVFANDDTFIPMWSSRDWVRRLMSEFRDPAVAAVGPTSNVVAGYQNTFLHAVVPTLEVPFLIGFFMMVRRSALNAVGGVVEGLPGGDDIDLSIRFRKAGYKILARKDVFIFHHGFKTGERVHGSYWNSQDMIEATNNTLIARHGLIPFYETMVAQNVKGLHGWDEDEDPDKEPETVAARGWVTGDKILEFGCGGRLTVPNAIGVDQVPEGEITDQITISKASLTANVFAPMPQFDDDSQDTLIARHLIEHCIDPFAVLREWRRILKVGGRLILTYPNEERCASMMLDPEHRHAWTPDSIRSLGEATGYKQVAYTPECGNGFSAVTVLEKVPL